MKIRYYNGRVLSMQQPLAVQEAELWTQDDKISYIGPTKADMPVFDREIELKGDLLMPGFKNAHAHSAMTFLRSYADDLPLHDWLYEAVFPHEARLDGDAVYWMSRLAFLEYLSSGITACFDMYMHLDSFAAAQADSGFRCVICGGANDFGGTAESTVREFETYNAKNSLLSYRMGFHAEYTTSAALMKELAQAAAAYKQPMFCHNAETKDEVAGCIERYHTTPTVYMDSIGMFEYGGGGFHCVHLSEEDRRIFQQRQLFVIANPASNMKLASGIAPLWEYDAAGIPLGLGTDGAASNNALNMFREMYLASGLSKLLSNDPKAMPAETVLRAATTGSALAMGLTGCDVLAVGKQADLIEIDLQQPNMQPEHDIIKNLVYSAGPQNVKRSVVAGKILYEEGIYHVGETPEYIYRKAAEAKQRLFA